MDGYTLVIITANGCGACSNLKNSGVMANIVNTTKQEGLHVNEINLETRGTRYSGSSKWDNFISRYLITWFPLFAVASNHDLTSYEHGQLSDQALARSIGVFNGRYDEAENRFKTAPVYRQVNPSVIMEWINTWKRTHTDQVQSKPTTRTRETPSDRHGTGLKPNTKLLITDDQSDRVQEVNCKSLTFEIRPHYNRQYS